ncbi:MAG: helix-turn-helix domain-containing protein [Chloroflexi bacterium]|nr:helix-turn-helix domain-containing protein [Chloroflexota bacterium]
MGHDMYSVREAARELGLSPRHVQRLLAKGEIQGKRIGRTWVVLSLDYKRKRKPKTRRRLNNEAISDTTKQALFPGNPGTGEHYFGMLTCSSSQGGRQFS